MDHGEALVAAHLMEVGVSHVVLDTIGWETSVTDGLSVSLVSLANSVAPVLDHLLLLVLDNDIEEEAAPKVEDHEAPHEANAVLLVEGIHFPVEVSVWILDEASDVLEGSPSLRVVSWLLGIVHEFAEVAISVLGQRSKHKQKKRGKLSSVL